MWLNDFFRQSVNNQTLSAWIKKYRSMMADSTRLDKLCSYAECYGYPQWNDYFFTYTDAGYLFAVPVIRVHSQVECLWFFEKKETDYFAFSTQRKSGGNIARFDWLYDYLALKMYGSNDKDIINISPSTRAMRCNDIYTGYTDRNGVEHTSYSYTYCWNDGIGGSSDFIYERDDFRNSGGRDSPITWEVAPPPDGGRAIENITTLKAKKIFRNSNMTDDNWAALENMIEKIMRLCMGKNLYNSLADVLDGRTLTTQFNDKNTGSSFSFDGKTSGISLSMDFESNQLMHEMMHAYQAYAETSDSYKGAVMNLEIEAHYAQYLYIRTLPEYRGSKWEENYTKSLRLSSIVGLKRYVDEKGQLKPGMTNRDLEDRMITTVLSSLKQDGYSTYPYNYDRIGVQNFKNLNKTTINC